MIVITIIIIITIIKIKIIQFNLILIYLGDKFKDQGTIIKLAAVKLNTENTK
jgi:hypothetical protein